MPIQIEKTGSIDDVQRELLELESEYKISSEEFSALTNPDEVVSEFDAIEWNFLLMQKRALEEDRCSSTSVFSGSYSTKTSTVAEDNMAYDLAA